MKIATWNVNGIRARQAELQDRGWSECSPTSCASRKSRRLRISCRCGCAKWKGIGATGTARKGIQASAFMSGNDFAAERPQFEHPAFDYENRIVLVRLPAVTVVSVYVPNGGKDFPAKLRFLDALELFAAEMRADANPIVICGDLNIARADIDVHPKERKPRAIGQLPEERAQLERIIGHGLVDVSRALEPDNDQMFTWWAPWRNMRQRNIGWRLDYLLASQRLFDRVAAARSNARPAPATTRRSSGNSGRALGLKDHGLRARRLTDHGQGSRIPDQLSVKLMVTVMMTGTGAAVHQRRSELPLLDGVERRLIEQGNRFQHVGLFDARRRYRCAFR